MMHTIESSYGDDAIDAAIDIVEQYYRDSAVQNQMLVALVCMIRLALEVDDLSSAKRISENIIHLYHEHAVR